MASPIKTPRGVQQHQEVRSAAEWRDIRSHGERFRAWVEKGDGLMFLGCMCLGVMWIWPQGIEFTFLAGMLFFRWASKQPFVLPFRMPATGGRVDFNDPKPGQTAPSKAQGIAFLGNEIGSKKELWLKNDDMRTHFLVFGSTGAGKALRMEEPVLTPTGWVRNGDLAVGQLVCTPDGGESEITSIHPQGELELWRLTFDDGRTIDVSGDHLWAVAPHDLYGPLSTPEPVEEEDWEVISTEELADRVMNGQWEEGSQGWGIPLALPVEGPEWVDAAELAERAIQAMKGKGTFPEVSVGPVKARRQLWRRLIDECGGRRMGRLIHFPSVPDGAADALLALARSLGAHAVSAAAIDGRQAEGTIQVNALFGERTLKVRMIERLEVDEACQCIKLADPRGLFITKDHLVTHNTETLISLAFNSLVQGSGFIYVDGKGDNSLWAKIFSLVRSMGREDDLLVINYMTGGKDVFGPQETKRSNTMNPFISGSAGGLTELLVSLMDEAGGDNAMWKGRAMSLISGLMFALVYLRDNDGLLLDVEVIRDHLILENIQKLARRRDLPPQVLSPLVAYLRSLPGYQEQAPKQSETVLDQHGYLQMQFTKILGSLSDTYGFIFKTNLGEVDFFDVVVNRRILVVLLPALEKSPDELSNLGKIIVACLRQMMATGLGDILEGDFEDVIEIKPTNAPAPYMCILDEYGYYVVKGASVMPAQARSLGFSMVFAGQDYPAFKKNNNAEEAISTIGNCNIKIFMKLEDPADTFDLFKQSVGEALVSKTTGFQHHQGVMGSYADQMGASIERRARGDLLDLKDQREGEAHILFKSTLVRAQMFYAAPINVRKLQLNHFLRVEPPKKQEIQEYKQAISDLTRMLLDHDKHEEVAKQHPIPLRLAVMNAVWGDQVKSGAGLRDAGLAALMAVQRLSHTKAEQFGQSAGQLRDALNKERPKVNIFTDPDLLDALDGGDEDEDEDEDDEDEDFDSEQEEEGTGEEDDQERLLLNQEHTRRRLAELEAASGVSAAEAASRAARMTKDMEAISSYPKQAPDPMEPDELMSIIQEIDGSFDEEGQ